MTQTIKFGCGVYEEIWKIVHTMHVYNFNLHPRIALDNETGHKKLRSVVRDYLEGWNS